MFYVLMYAFQSESTLYSCLNVKELLARSRREIWILSNCNWTRTHHHLVHKRTLNHLAKLADWVFVYELSGCGYFSWRNVFFRQKWHIGSQFFGLSTACLKLSKFLTVFLKPGVSFCRNFALCYNILAKT